MLLVLSILFFNAVIALYINLKIELLQNKKVFCFTKSLS